MHVQTNICFFKVNYYNTTDIFRIKMAWRIHMKEGNNNKQDCIMASADRNEVITQMEFVFSVLSHKHLSKNSIDHTEQVNN